MVCSVALYPPANFEDHTKPPIIPTSDNLIEHAKRTHSAGIISVPSFYETWITQPDIVEWLKTMPIVLSGGGPLGINVGDSLAKAGVPIRSVWGGTEFGTPVALVGDEEQQRLRTPADWNYQCLSKLVNVRWAPQGDGTFECQLLDTEHYKVSVENLPDVKGYATRDLVGRLDDVIILASGENVVPGPMESVIVSSPLISGAVVFGRGRSQVGVLLEPLPDVVVGELADFKNKIWPVIEEANKTEPAFGRIYKEMILVTSAGRPLPRVAKGTVAKQHAVTLYQSEINALYEQVDASLKAAANVSPPKTWSRGNIQIWLEAQAKDIVSGRAIAVDVDLFEQGFDSLSATFLRNRIISTLQNSTKMDVSNAAKEITQNFVFANPKITQLATRIEEFVTGNSVGALADALATVEAMIDQYSIGLDAPVASASSIESTFVVLLTGTTGGLGSFLLESLLKEPCVTKVYAFNRPGRNCATIQPRQRAAFADKGFDVDLLTSPKLAYVEGDTAHPQLGLSATLYTEIRNSVTTIIHNAWRLDFNLALASFESNVRGTRHLIDLARQARRAPRAETRRKADAGVALGGGYGEGKYVCERILAKSGLQATSFRIGQICGGLPNGAWATTDWVPALVKSSVALGVLPSVQGEIAWLPMHAVSRTILDAALTPATPSLALNVVHPKPVPWAVIMRPLGEALCRAGVTPAPLPLVPFAEWLARLEKRAAHADENEMRAIPAIQLLAFFRGFAAADAAGGFPVFATEKAQAASPALGALPQIGAGEAERWVGYWKSVGFFL
ncbi:hypothetical protein HWV62_41154 [Athelia sp. TMB]|nr:hypothetical protein HWV62_41154 [Athelia sp. TMB]